MNFFKDFKTEIKLLLIVALIAVVVSVAGILLLRKLTLDEPPASISQEMFSTQKSCEQETGRKCMFFMCDVVPEGMTFEEVCGGVGKGWQPTEEALEFDTSTWQTYRNDEFGFEVKYPTDWFLTSFRSVPPADIYGWTTMSIFSPDREVEVFISRGIPYEHVAPGGITASRTPQAIIENKRKGFAGYSLEEEQVSIGSREAVKFTHSDSYAFIDVYVPLNDTILLQITQRAKSQKGESYEPIFDQMLSTFRFTD